MLCGMVKCVVVEGSAVAPSLWVGTELAEEVEWDVEGADVWGEDMGEGVREDQIGEEVFERGGDCEGGGEVIADSISGTVGSACR